MKKERLNGIHMKMNNTKMILILLKVLQKTHDDHSNPREYFDKSITDV